MEEKIFINGVFLREKTFDNGGSIINIDITNIDDFTNQLKQNQKAGGKITLEIKERRNKSDNGLTHYIQVSTFEPQQREQVVDNQTHNNDGLPF